MISEPSRYYAVELQALPSRIGQVRRIVSAHLRHWQLDALVDHAVLGVTELLTNVHRHAQPDKRCTVEIELLLDRLTVSVRDHDPRIPQAVACPDPLDPLDAYDRGDGYDGLATSGRGLTIVGAVSESWGVRPCGADGKVVWFTLAAPRPCVPVATRAYAVYGSTTEGPLVGYAPFPGVPLSAPADPALTPALEPVLAPAPAGAAARRVPAGRAG
ncbi:MULTISPECIES: ATP-binding protein [unclassified Streptomyces]|uniref:ATP-binding protein n=1 Tax=unclassified Streptomyces TaxID=2593676 RepID=UPI0029677291|nr:ATP-binding protein [Streptomyces sp. SJL17-1]